MQISKSLLVIGSAFLCIAPQCVRAADTDAQVKAREALRQKMNELQPQSGGSESVATTPAAAPDKTTRRATQAQPVKPPRSVAPAPTVVAPVSTPEVVAAPPADSGAQVKAREALRQKMNELQPQSGGIESVATTPAAPDKTTRRAKPPQAQPVKPPRSVAPAPTVVVPVPTPEVVTAPPADSEAVAKSREALRKKMEELQVQPLPETPAPVTPPVVVKPKRPARVAPAPQFHTPPAAAPTFTSPPGPRSPSTIPEFRTPAPQPAVVVAPPTPAPTPQPPVAAQPQTPPPDTQPRVVATQPQTPASPSDSRWEAEQAAQNQAKTKPKAAKPPKNLKSAPAFRPLEGPPLNISADKQQRLGELLRRYQADEITPAQYHEERAKILAQP